MRLFPMISGQGRALLAQAGAALVVSALIAGCGNNYRPVVTPVTPSGPAAQPTSYAVVVSSASATTPGEATIVDYSGDTVMAEAPIGNGPLAFTIDEVGANGYTINSDGTLTNFPITTSLQAKNIFTSTLSFTADPINMMAPSSGLYAADLNGNVVDEFSGSPEKLLYYIPVGTAASPATMPVSIFGPTTLTGLRDYVLSQSIPDTDTMTCTLTPAAATANGVATGIEIASNVADAPIVLDPFAASGSLNARCPVYAVQSTDQKRMFVINRGSDTVSVINSQNNTLDQCTPFLNQNGQTVACHPILPLSTTAVTNLTAAAAAMGDTTTPTAPPNGTAGMPAIAGPLDAVYNAATEQLVVADYDGGTISMIDVSLDEYGNDSATFGTTYTIAVGNTANPEPAGVTVLFDGSKAYTANQGDCSPDCIASPNGTVSVVNLSTHTLETTLPVVGYPRTVVSTQNSEYSKVYTASPDSPYVTIIESTPTTTDQVDTTVLVEGNVVDVRVTTENGTSGNSNYTSRVPGYGQPCNLPPAVLAASYGPSYTLAECRLQAIP
jgi:DNA-binding beta-propeller fold protein YncE